MDYFSFLSKKKLLPGSQGPIKDFIDFRPGELFTGGYGFNKNRYCKGNFEIHED